MKKIPILCLMLALTVKVFCQADTTVQQYSLKTDYLKKSKTQKTIAWVMLGTGTTMMATGLIISGNAAEKDPIGSTIGVNNDFNSGALLFVIGGLVDLGSIPFFISGAKNKGRAMSVTIHNDLVPQLQKSELTRVPVPTVSLVLRF